MKIMLFDETPERSLFLRMTLERLGHEIVAEVADSRQLYDAVRSHSPDAIIIDTESPSAVYDADLPEALPEPASTSATCNTCVF
jgi:CheY-like chemotaxis protein